MPSHVAARDFPATARGARRLRLRHAQRHRRQHAAAPPRYLHASQRSCPTGCIAIRDYVANGGGLVMIGGYMTFQGIEAKAQYAGSAVEEALPVTIDRERRPRRGTAGRRARSRCGRPSDRRRRHRPLARPARLQPRHAEARRHAGRQGRRRSADRRRHLRQGPRGRLHLRLRPALGAAALRRMARLHDALERHRRLGGRRMSRTVEQPARSLAAHHDRKRLCRRRGDLGAAEMPPPLACSTTPSSSAGRCTSPQPEMEEMLWSPPRP